MSIVFILNLTAQREIDQSVKKLDRYLTLDVVCTSLQFSPDGRFLAMINEHSNIINIWDFTAQKLFSHFEFGAVFSQMKWSPDGAYLAVSCDKLLLNFGILLIPSIRFRALYIYEVFAWQKQKWNFKAPVNVEIFYLVTLIILSLANGMEIRCKHSLCLFEGNFGN